MDGNYIKICRSLLDWEWYTNENTMRLFVHCLLKANWKDGRFEGMEIPRGSFVTSIPKLAEELEITPKQVRTALEHLKKSGEVAVKTTNKFSVVTVNNYSRYQDKGSQRADKGQAKGRQRATIEEGKKGISISKDIQCVMDAWNELGLSQVRQIASGSKRYSNLKARIKEHGVDGVLEAIEKVKQSDFLQGGGDRGWVVTFDWLVKSADNFQKVFEGQYNDTKAKKGGDNGYKLFK